MKGKFVNIEGLDGCGKSTHVKLLAQWLRSQGHEVVMTDEPTDGKIGKVIKMILSGELKVPISAESLLFAADRLQHVESVIEPAVDSGKIVLNERYVPSSIAYQSARGIPIEWVKKINDRAPRPNLTILIDVPVEVALARMNSSRRLDEFERDLKLQRKVRQAYLMIARSESIKVIDGNRPIDEVQGDIRKLASAIL